MITLGLLWEYVGISIGVGAASFVKISDIQEKCEKFLSMMWVILYVTRKYYFCRRVKMLVIIN